MEAPFNPKPNSKQQSDGIATTANRAVSFVKSAKQSLLNAELLDTSPDAMRSIDCKPSQFISIDRKRSFEDALGSKLLNGLSKYSTPEHLSNASMSKLVERRIIRPIPIFPASRGSKLLNENKSSVQDKSPIYQDYTIPTKCDNSPWMKDYNPNHCGYRNNRIFSYCLYDSTPFQHLSFHSTIHQEQKKLFYVDIFLQHRYFDRNRTTDAKKAKYTEQVLKDSLLMAWKVFVEVFRKSPETFMDTLQERKKKYLAYLTKKEEIIQLKVKSIEKNAEPEITSKECVDKIKLEMKNIKLSTESNKTSINRLQQAMEKNELFVERLYKEIVYYRKQLHSP